MSTKRKSTLSLSLKGTAPLPRLLHTGAAQKKAYIRNISYPLGIGNVANYCYASGVLHLVNHPTFQHLPRLFDAVHDFTKDTISAQ